MTRKTTVRRHLRRTRKGRVPVRRHKRKLNRKKKNYRNFIPEDYINLEDYYKLTETTGIYGLDKKSFLDRGPSLIREGIIDRNKAEKGLDIIKANDKQREIFWKRVGKNYGATTKIDRDEFNKILRRYPQIKELPDEAFSIEKTEIIPDVVDDMEVEHKAEREKIIAKDRIINSKMFLPKGIFDPNETIKVVETLRLPNNKFLTLNYDTEEEKEPSFYLSDTKDEAQKIHKKLSVFEGLEIEEDEDDS